MSEQQDPERKRGHYAKGLTSRNTLLDCAQRVFNERGASTTLDDIARQLDWTKGRITHHFNTKDDLLRALMDRCSMELDANAMKHGAITDMGRLAALYRDALDIIDTYRMVYVMTSVNNTLDTDLHSIAEQRMKHRLEVVRPFMQHLVEQGLLRDEATSQRDHDTIAAATVLTFLGWPLYRCTLGRALSYQHARSILLRCCLQIFTPFASEKGLRQLQTLMPSL